MKKRQSNDFWLALIQMKVMGGKPADNLERASALVRFAAEQGASVVLLPEAMNLGWTHPSARTSAELIPSGPSSKRLRNLAATHGIFVCAGLIELAGSQVFNSAILINSQGEIVVHTRKLNELEIGHSYYTAGDRIGVAHTSLGTIGVMICADGFAPGQVIARTLGYMGAQIILSPSSWAVPADHDNFKTPYGAIWLENYCPVASDFGIWIASTSNVGKLTAGPWRGRKCIGCSLVIGPDGSVAARGNYGENAEQILVVNISPRQRPTWGDGWAKRWSVQSPHRQPEKKTN